MRTRGTTSSPIFRQSCGLERIDSVATERLDGLLLRDGSLQEEQPDKPSKAGRGPAYAPRRRILLTDRERILAEQLVHAGLGVADPAQGEPRLSAARCRDGEAGHCAP
jgi:hypothetical protein